MTTTVRFAPSPLSANLTWLVVSGVAFGLVVAFRAWGVLAAMVMCLLIATQTKLLETVGKGNANSWLIGQALLTLAALAILAPFSGYIGGLDWPNILADAGFTTFNFDRVQLALGGKQDLYPFEYSCLTKPGRLVELITWLHPAHFVAAYASSFWFAIALPKIVAIGAYAPSVGSKFEPKLSPLARGLLTLPMIALMIPFLHSSHFLLDTRYGQSCPSLIPLLYVPVIPTVGLLGISWLLARLIKTAKAG